ncbi:MAG: GntR family transcriptional regulator [Robiginitomaculum sp.]|nr:GntR family transcriptional regulator [Robiginitomaculum sp.]
MAKRVRRMTSDDIVAEVIALLESKVYHPGDRLREQELADRFGVSRGPVREALRALEAKSLVRIEPMRGAYVTRLSDKDAKDSVEISAALFALVVQKASGCDAKSIQTMRTGLDELKAMVTPDISSRKFFQQTLKIGLDIVAVADSARLEALLIDLRLGIPNLYGPLGFTSIHLREQAVEKWVKLIDAIECNDAEIAAKLAKELNMDSLKAALEILG